jgi:glycosyltransferase involved in cell wall biosynthesis
MSVIIAAWNGSTALRLCLASLVTQLDVREDEIIIVSNFESDDIQDLLFSFPSVRHVRLASDTDVPHLRSRGIQLARGEIVALLEDHSTLDRHWSAEIRKAHQLPYSIIGGSVENHGVKSKLTWAVYFYDYGKYMLPGVGRVFTSLSGNNISYKRKVLDEIRDQYQDGFHETFINQTLQRRGYDLYFMPSAVIYHNKSYALKKAVIDSFHHGRLFAARRVARARLALRAFRGLVSPLLPVLLPGRVLITTVRKRRHLMEVVACFPYLFLLMTAWSCGEFCGYLLGEGASAGKWK